MASIDPVEINTHIAQNLNASKVKDIQETRAQGTDQYPQLQKKDDDHQKTSVNKVDSTENAGIDPDGENKSEEEKKKKKEKEEKDKQEHEEKMNKLKNLFGDAKHNRGGSIDIKL
ncbi:MAG: hypothetical protein M0R46_02610 [Candidatus Muirbacterium halophilum]|nr:hypothetical protein [Candidatus Muirbacterium halophilum]MCK9474782.1 hypothetical protein [Candidatus Muirbacterium halophilum]